jgi:hypothetical protein
MALLKKILGSSGVSDKVQPNALTEQERVACMDIAQSLLAEQEVGGEVWLSKVQQIWPSKPVNFTEVLAKLEIFSRTAMALALYRAGIRDVNEVGQLIEKAFSSLSESDKELLKEDKQTAIKNAFVIYAQRLKRAEEILAKFVEPKKE